MMFRKKTLRGKKVAVLAADGFERVELTIPCKALRRAGAEVHVISLHPGKIRSMNLTAPSGTVRVDRTLTEAHPEDYDALLIPGGFIGPDFLRQSQRRATSYGRSTRKESRSPLSATGRGCWLRQIWCPAAPWPRGPASVTTSFTQGERGATSPWFAIETGCRHAGHRT